MVILMKNLTREDKLDVILLTLALLPNVFPIITLYIDGVILTNVFFLGWWFSKAIFSYNKSIVMDSRVLFPVLVLYAMYFLAMIVGNTIFGNRYLDLSVIYWGVVVCAFYRQTGKMHILKKIFIVLAPFVIFTVFRTAIALMTDPWISRAIKSEGEESVAILKTGVSGYQLIYMLSALSPICLYIFLNEKRAFFKIVSICAYTCCFYTVIISNYFTALTSILISSILMIALYLYNKKSFLEIIILVLMVVLILFFSESISNNIIDFLIDLSPQGKTAQRLGEMRGSLIDSFANEMKVDRLPTLQLSFETLIKNPILGVFADDYYGLNPMYKLGQHSHILDTLAIWGLIIGGLNIYILFLPFKKTRIKNRGKVLTVPMLVTSIIIYGFNNAINSVSIIIFLVYPYVFFQYNEKEN